MKRILAIFATSVMLASCANTWDSETKEMFHQSCMEDAADKVNTPADAKLYCDCVLEKIMEKYPRYEDALMHIDSVTFDPNVQKCKEGRFKE